MGRRKRREKRNYRRGRKSRPRIYRRKHPVTIQVQGRMLQMSVRTARVPGSGGIRGSIEGFSRQSRKRMMETALRVDWERAGFVCFATLGYPDRHGPPSLAQTERDRQVLLKRIDRLHPNASAIWRREWEPRKSGAFPGVVFPHYHLLFFGLPFLHYSDLNAMWRDVLGYPYYVRTEIRKVHSWRQALYYVAKYMAKRPGGGPRPEAGEVRREADTPRGVRAGSLVYVAYLTARTEAEEARKNKGIVGEEWQAIKERKRLAALQYRLDTIQRQSRERRGKPEKESASEPEESVERVSIGRSWGIFNRDNLPMAKRRVWRGRAGKWLELTRPWAKKYWSGIDTSENTGFTLFLEDADKAFDELCNLRKPKP